VLWSATRLGTRTAERSRSRARRRGLDRTENVTRHRSPKERPTTRGEPKLESDVGAVSVGDPLVPRPCGPKRFTCPERKNPRAPDREKCLCRARGCLRRLTSGQRCRVASRASLCNRLNSARLRRVRERPSPGFYPTTAREQHSRAGPLARSPGVAVAARSRTCRFGTDGFF